MIFNSNTENMKQEYLDIFEEIKLDVMYTKK